MGISALAASMEKKRWSAFVAVILDALVLVLVSEALEFSPHVVGTMVAILGGSDASGSWTKKLGGVNPVSFSFQLAADGRRSENIDQSRIALRLITCSVTLSIEGENQKKVLATKELMPFEVRLSVKKTWPSQTLTLDLG